MSTVEAITSGVEEVTIGVEPATTGETREGLGDRMKQYEKHFDITVDHDKPYIVRLDGAGFSKFTVPFIQPFDTQFTKAMVATMNDLVEKYSAVTGYTHSDEITLIFPACTEKQVHLYSGRIMKLTSILASYAATRFLFHLRTQYELHRNEYMEKQQRKIDARLNDPVISFDARILTFPNDAEILNHMIWRSRHDCYRNCISKIAHYTFGHKSILNKSCDELAQMLLEKKSLDIGSYPFRLSGMGNPEDGLRPIHQVPENIATHLKWGVIAKRERKITNVTTPKGPVTVERNVIVNHTGKIEYSDENVKEMLASHWNSLSSWEVYTL